MIDIDCFKQFNDAYGHQAGDECLRRIAKVLKETASVRRPGDKAARYGGEEFAVVLSGTGSDFALQTAKRISRAVQAEKIVHKTTRVKNTRYISISLGVASMIPLPNTDVFELVNQADNALYLAKANGRNRIEVGSKT